MDVFTDLLNWVISNVSRFLAVLSTSLLIYYLAYPEKAQIIAGHIYKAIGWAGTYFQKKSVVNDILGRYQLAKKRVNAQIPGLLTDKKIEIEWVKPSSIEPKSFMESDRIIVKMGYYRENALNLVNVIHCLVQEQHLKQLKNYVDKPLEDSLNLALTKQCLSLSNSKEALKLFARKILKRELEAKPELKEVYHKVEAIDQIGFFTRILLAEFIKMASELFPEKVQLPSILQECDKFVDFLHNFAIREPKEDIKLSFIGVFISVNIMLVAKQDTLSKGYGPYLDRIEESLTGNVNTVYICAFDNLRSEAETVSILAKRNFGVKIISKSNYRALYHGQERKAICINVRC